MPDQKFRPVPQRVVGLEFQPFNPEFPAPRGTHGLLPIRPGRGFSIRQTLPSPLLFFYPDMGESPEYQLAILVRFFVSFVYIVFSFLRVEIIGIRSSKQPLTCIQ